MAEETSAEVEATLEDKGGTKENEEVPRKRRKGWDQTTPAVKGPEQTGPLVSPAALPKLTTEQLNSLQMAKKYCHDVSSKFKQTEQQVIQMQALQDAANKQRALLLMSRIYVGSINFELGEEMIRNAFSPFGTIKTINMSWDNSTMKHKGYSFVEYETAEGAQLALEQMNGVVIGGRNIKVGRPNNVPQAAPVIARIQQEAAKYPRIYLASIHADLSSDDVRSVFEAFGKVKKIDLAPDNTPGKHRGWGYVEYESQKNAADAIASMNLFDLGGQFLRVGRALTPPMTLYPPNAGPILPGLINTGVSNIAAMQAAAKAQAAFPVLNEPGLEIPSVFGGGATVGGIVGGGAPSVAGKNLLQLQAKLAVMKEEKQKAEDVMTLQQEESMSISGSNARIMIMKKLSRKSESKVVVLRNMVDTEDLDEEIEDEVTSECSKYGSVEKVIIYQEKQGMEDDAEVVVKIFVVFSAASEAETAVKTLEGRWFGGKVIKADLYDTAKFETNDLSC